MSVSLRRLCGLICGSFWIGTVLAQAAEPAAPNAYWTYFGTYTRGASEGIYVARFDLATGKFGEVALAAPTEDPSFLAIHPAGNHLYAVGETAEFENQATGFVRAFAIDMASGKLNRLNSQRSAGVGPCHLVVDAQGQTVLVANYGSGTVASIRIEADHQLGDVVSSHQHTGSSANEQRQKDAHAHSINLDAANRFAFAADLGIDQVVAYRFNPATGQLDTSDAPAAVHVPPGSGPRHFAFHPSGKFAYVINELLSTVVAFAYDADSGTLRAIQNISTLPDDNAMPSFTAEVVVHPSGNFVYGSNRGHDSIAVFQVDPATGQLTRAQVASTGGRTPRNFAIEPSGQFLFAANQDSDTVVVYRIQPDNGTLSATGENLSVPMPVCVRFLPVRP